MPTINKPFLLKVLLVVLAFVGLLVGVHTVQADRIPSALRRQAERALEGSRTDVAIRYLRQYLEFCPDDVDVQIQLVNLLRKRQGSVRAQAEIIFLYDRILRVDPDRHDIRRDALETCFSIARFSDAVTHAQALLKVFPTEAALWQQLGAAQAGLNQLADAKSSYETAISLDPTEIVSYQRLAQLVWRNMNDPDGAREVLNRLVDGLPQNPEAHLLRARFETFIQDEPGSGQGDLKRATIELYRVLEIDPENADAMLLLADVYQRERNVVAAHNLLRDGVALYPRDLRLIRSLSWLELVRGNAPAAIGVLEDGLKASPDAFDLLVPLADLLVQQGDSLRTAEILHQLEVRKAAPLQVKYLKARVSMRDGKWVEATDLLQSLRGEATHLPGLEIQLNQLLAFCANKLGDAVGEETAYQRVVQADAKNVPAHVGLGHLYLTLGRFDEAARELESAAQSPYAAGSVVSEWVRTRIHLLKSSASGGSADEWRRLEQGLMTAAATFGPVSSEPILLQAEIGAAMGKSQDAIQLLRRETARRPGDARLWATLAETVASVSGTAAGLSIVDEAQATLGDAPDLRLARARLYAGEPGRVRSLAALSDRIDAWPEAEQLQLLYGLVEVYDRMGDQAGVVANLRRIAARRPADANVWIQVYERALRIGDAKAASEAKAALVKLEGAAGSSVLLCEAASARPVDANDLIGRFGTVFGPKPTRADACLALGRLFRLNGNDPQEGELIERAFSLEPTRFEAARAWLTHVCRLGDETRTGELAARLARDPRWAGEPFRRLVADVVGVLPKPTAEKLLNGCRTYVEKDPGGLGWLAETAARHQVFDPIPVLNEATQRPMATADDWLRVAIFAGPDKLRAARARLQPTAYLAAAAVFRETAQGKDFDPAPANMEQKRLFAQACLALQLSRGKSEAATKVLEDYLANEELPPKDIAWGKRNLAMMFAVGGTPDDRKRAMELIKNVTENETSAEDLRAMASVLTTLSRYLEGSDRITVLNKAAAALNTAYVAGKSTKDLFNLSQLYRTAGNRAESRKCLQTLLNSDQNNLYFLAAALEEHMEDRNLEAGAAFAQKLLAEHPGEFRAVAAVARFECLANRPMEALGVAEHYAQAANPSAGDHLSRSARVAELLDELSRHPNVRGTAAGHAMAEAAAERFTGLIPSHPEAIVGLAGLLTADGRSTDAFARIDRLGGYIPTRLRAAAGLSALRSGSVSEQQAATVRKWIDAALAEDSTSTTLQLNKAEFFALRQELPQAIAQYEAILAAEPNNVVALNNLAWLLAADPRTAERAQELVARATREVGLTGDLLDTRARVRITLKLFSDAERDLGDAIRLESTPLRWFHLALSRLGQSPTKSDDAAKAFREAKRRGLEPKNIHPADLPTFKILDSAKTQG
jgi:tetratricopeptide (TPR) repeat protein